MVFASQSADGWCVSLLADAGEANVTVVGNFFELSHLFVGRPRA